MGWFNFSIFITEFVCILVRLFSISKLAGCAFCCSSHDVWVIIIHHQAWDDGSLIYWYNPLQPCYFDIQYVQTSWGLFQYSIRLTIMSLKVSMTHGWMINCSNHFEIWQASWQYCWQNDYQMSFTDIVILIHNLMGLRFDKILRFLCDTDTDPRLLYRQ